MTLTPEDLAKIEVRVNAAEHNTLRSANQSRQREWDTSNQITLAYRGNELAGEVGEACNVIKKLERERIGIAGSRDTKEHLAEELADIVICTDLIAMDVGIDLDAAVVAKFNTTSEKIGLSTKMAAREDILSLIAALKEAWAEIERFKQQDSAAATHVESLICMRTHFTGDPPYVGWKGLGLALKEHLDAQDERIAALAGEKP